MLSYFFSPAVQLSQIAMYDPGTSALSSESGISIAYRSASLVGRGRPLMSNSQIGIANLSSPAHHEGAKNTKDQEASEEMASS
jgi:hypothetical protein